MIYKEAVSEVRKGKRCRRASWEPTRFIRMSTVGDNDFINYDNLAGLIVSECPEVKCDCYICLYNATLEDINADDFELVN